jgi:hypothetical protein
MSHDAGARLAPFISSPSGKVIPVERFGVELSFRPIGKTIQHIALRLVLALSSRSMCWLRELVFKVLIGTHAHQENSPPVLRNRIIFCIQDGPLHSVACCSVADKLVAQQVSIISEHHPINVFYYEGLWQNVTQDAIEFAVKEISVVGLPFALAALSIALTWVTADQYIGSSKLAKVANVPALNVWAVNIFFVGVTSGLPDIVCPDDLVPELLQGVVGPAAPAKE